MYCRELGIYINHQTTKYVVLDNAKEIKRADISDEEYEALCTKVEKVFMSQSDMDCDIDAVAHAINDFIAEKEMSISEVLKLDRDTIIEQASYWI